MDPDKKKTWGAKDETFYEVPLIRRVGVAKPRVWGPLLFSPFRGRSKTHTLPSLLAKPTRGPLPQARALWFKKRGWLCKTKQGPLGFATQNFACAFLKSAVPNLGQVGKQNFLTRRLCKANLYPLACAFLEKKTLFDCVFLGGYAIPFRRKGGRSAALPLARGKGPLSPFWGTMPSLPLIIVRRGPPVPSLGAAAYAAPRKLRLRKRLCLFQRSPFGTPSKDVISQKATPFSKTEYPKGEPSPLRVGLGEIFIAKPTLINYKGWLCNKNPSRPSPPVGGRWGQETPWKKQSFGELRHTLREKGILPPYKGEESPPYPKKTWDTSFSEGRSLPEEKKGAEGREEKRYQSIPYAPLTIIRRLRPPPLLTLLNRTKSPKGLALQEDGEVKDTLITERWEASHSSSFREVRSLPEEERGPCPFFKRQGPLLCKGKSKTELTKQTTPWPLETGQKSNRLGPVRDGVAPQSNAFWGSGPLGFATQLAPLFQRGVKRAGAPKGLFAKPTWGPLPQAGARFLAKPTPSGGAAGEIIPPRPLPQIGARMGAPAPTRQDIVSITYEEIGFFPRSFSRVLDRFLKQVFSDVENLVIQEYRFYRYLFLTTLKCVLILFFVPFMVNYFSKTYLVSPLTEYFWNTQQTEIFLNSYQQKRAFTELKDFEEKLYFESLINCGPCLGQKSEAFSKGMGGIIPPAASPEGVGFARQRGPLPFFQKAGVLLRKGPCPLYPPLKEGGNLGCEAKGPLALASQGKNSPLFHTPTWDFGAGLFDNPALKIFRAGLVNNPALASQRKQRFGQSGFWGSLALLTPSERGGQRISPLVSFIRGPCPPPLFKGGYRGQGPCFATGKEEFKESGGSKAEFIRQPSTWGLPVRNIPTWDNLPPTRQDAFEQRLQEKTIELAIRYNNQSIEAITNFFADLLSFLTLCYLLIILEIQINITKSFLLEVFFGLDDGKKSLFILLITDLLVGYHSSNLWELFFEFLFNHYGLPESQTGIFLLVATLPVLLDVLFKYLIFRHLNRSSPATVATYRAIIE